MNRAVLREFISPTQGHTVIESRDTPEGKSWHMKGLFIEGDVRNANERIYPRREIANAVGVMREQLARDIPLLGECDHPDDLKINLDRVSHVITDIFMEGSDGIGTLKIIPTPMGNTIAAMLGAGIKLGVSSRGSGNVDESTGYVSDFEIVTVDVVAQPSAPNAYPRAIYEGLMNMYGGQRLFNTMREPAKNSQAQKYVTNQILRFIKDLRIQ